MTLERERDVEATIGVIYVKGNPAAKGKRAVTGDVPENASWFASRPAVSRNSPLLTASMKKALVSAFKKHVPGLRTPTT